MLVGLKAMMSGEMQEIWLSLLVLVILIILYYIFILIVIIYKLCKHCNNSISNDCPPSYDVVIELDEMSCPSYTEINV